MFVGIVPSTCATTFMRRPLAKVAFLGGGTARVEVANIDLHRHVELLDVLFNLHRRRWEAFRPGESTFHSEFRMRFNRELLGRLPIGDGYFSMVSVNIRRAHAIRVFGRTARGRVLERLFMLKGGIKRGLATARVRVSGATGGATRTGSTRGIAKWN